MTAFFRNRTLFGIFIIATQIYQAFPQPLGSTNEPEKKQVFVIPHSHDDVGWLWTYDELYQGTGKGRSNPACVKCIINSTSQHIQDKPDRTFQYVEMAFFKRWWHDEGFKNAEMFKNLLKNERRIDFLGGGMCSNDEATAYYDDIIRNFQLGHRFLLEEFDFKPSINWQLDPFGHSSTNTLLAAQMGFLYEVVGRINTNEIQSRGHNHSLEFIWDPKQNSTELSQIHMHVLRDTYLSTNGFRWDKFNTDRISPSFSMNNRDQLKDKFHNEIKGQQSNYQRNSLLWLYGDDFAWSDAEYSYSQMDQFKTYFNSKDKDFELEYHVASDYFSKINDAERALQSTYLKDFFPLDMGGTWSGYFTSRPFLKQ